MSSALCFIYIYIFFSIYTIMSFANRDNFIFSLVPFYLFLAVLGLLHCCAWAFSSCGEWGLLFVVVRRLLIAVASLVAEHGL